MTRTCKCSGLRVLRLLVTNAAIVTAAPTAEPTPAPTSTTPTTSTNVPTRSIGHLIMSRTPENDSAIWDHCETASSTSDTLAKCYEGIIWGMLTGIHVHPDWYPTLKEGHREVEDFQEAFHNDPEDENHCTKVPCPRTTTSSTTTTTTTSTAPFGTPACPPRAALPPLPNNATDNNGISWPTYCYTGYQDEHVFLIGDWGGLVNYNTRTDEWRVHPADNTVGHEKEWRNFVPGIDDRAQWLIAQEMAKRALTSDPRYILNSGDNFYWAGINAKCNSVPFGNQSMTNQWTQVFEEMYKGPGLDGKPWFGTLGNHDYGGFVFNDAWDQQIAYTYTDSGNGSPSGRWILPGQYWHQHVDYLTKGFSVDYYMVDSNVFDAMHPYHDPGHNICSYEHNHGPGCEPYGPKDVWDCKKWFDRLWKEQLAWLDVKLNESRADWQIVVSHFPPQWDWGSREWAELSDKYGIDLYVGAHRHQQEIHEWGEGHMPFIVCGGGGGVTSEQNPANDGHGWGPSQYGFLDMHITKDWAYIESINHAGLVRRTMNITKRLGYVQRERMGLTEEVSKSTEVTRDIQRANEMAMEMTNGLMAGDDVDKEQSACDGMGDLVTNHSCSSYSFMGAQVTGLLTFELSSPEAFIQDASAEEAMQKAIQLMSRALHHMDVEVRFSRSAQRGRRLQGKGAIEVGYKIEASTEQATWLIGDEMNKQTLTSVDSFLQQQPALQAYGMSTTGLWVDGWQASDIEPTAEAEAEAKAAGGNGYSVIFYIAIGCLLVFVFSMAVLLGAHCASGDVKKRGLGYKIAPNKEGKKGSRTPDTARSQLTARSTDASGSEDD